MIQLQDLIKDFGKKTDNRYVNEEDDNSVNVLLDMKEHSIINMQDSFNVRDALKKEVN